MLNVSCTTEATLLKPIQRWTHKPIYFCSCLLNINHIFPLSHPLCIGVCVCLGDWKKCVWPFYLWPSVCTHVCVHQVFVGVCLSCRSVLVSVIVWNFSVSVPSRDILVLLMFLWDTTKNVHLNSKIKCCSETILRVLWNTCNFNNHKVGHLTFLYLEWIFKGAIFYIVF